MDQYRIKIKNRMLLGRLICALSVGVIILDQVGVFDQIGFISEFAFMSSFQMGFLVGISFVAVMHLFKMHKALKDEKVLKALYNEEFDERLQLIRYKSGMPFIAITSSILIFAGVIAGYMNTMIFYTLISAGFFQLVASVCSKFYFMKKM